MALNKSGLPPQKRPVVAAERPGGFGTVKPGKPSLNMGSIDIGSLKGTPSPSGPSGPTKLGKGVPTAKFARGGSVRLGPKLPKIPDIKF